MGNISSCPAGFETGVFLTCRAQCPAEFKYAQESGSPPVETCVHVTRNDKKIRLTVLPAPQSGQPLSNAYDDEKVRIGKEAEEILKQIREDAAVGESRNAQTREYEKIQSDYASFTERSKDVQELKKVNESLRPFRPPTAPASDLEKERQKILDANAKSLLLVQVALGLVVLALLAYLLLPVDYAHGIAFLFLCVAISFGFFLRR